MIFYQCKGLCACFPNWSTNDENKDLHRDQSTTILMPDQHIGVSKRSVISDKSI
jgi:hypothetical protein